MKKQTKKEIIEEADITNRVPLLCPTLNFDEEYVVELINFGLHPSFAPDSASAHHLHDHIEIHVTFSGSGIAVVGQDSYSFGAGQFIVNTPQKIHYWETDKEPLSMLIIGIKAPEPMGHPVSDTQRLFKNFLEATDVVYTTPASFESLYANLANELKIRSLGYVAIVRALLKVIILELARNVAKKKAVKSRLALPAATPFTSDSIVEEVHNFINHNLSEKMSLKMMALVMSTSERNLTRHYRQATGRTIGEEIHELRIARAEELIRETKLSAKTVARQCGFSSGTYFSKQFRKKFNCSPTEYRNQIADNIGDFE